MFKSTVTNWLTIGYFCVCERLFSAHSHVEIELFLCTGNVRHTFVKISFQGRRRRRRRVVGFMTVDFHVKNVIRLFVHHQAIED